MMKDDSKTKRQLLSELVDLRLRISELEAAENRRKQAEEALHQAHRDLKETKQYIEGLIESSANAIISTDREGKITFFSPGARAQFGYLREEIVGQHVTMLYENEDKAREMINLMRDSDGTVAGFEATLRAKDGSLIPTSISASFLYDEDGKVAGTVGFGKDLRGQRQTEEALRQSEEKYRRLVETMNDGLAVVDENGVVTYVNRKLCEMFGYPQDEMLGQPATRFLDEANMKLFQEQLARRRKGEREPYEIEWIRKDGWKICTITSPEPIVDKDGRYQGSFGVLTDITERKQAEETMRLATERMRQQLEAARIIQQSFLPRTLPGADDPRFSLGALNHPAAAVGGDYYDVVPIGPDRLGLVLGDVSGKGVPGAIYMARLVSDFRFLVDPQERSPAETLIALNRILLDRGQSGMFVTMLYLTLNLDTGVASFANAGHLPLLVRRVSGTVDELDEPAGPPLGIIEDIVYENRELALMPGENLLLFTDGVTEAMNPAREQFSHDRLLEVFLRAPTCPEALVTAVAEAVRGFSRDAPAHDDLTLLAARWKGNGPQML
jgi:sigma-B regulation protein RsbU (phosphoserine phosphatase)